MIDTKNHHTSTNVINSRYYTIIIYITTAFLYKALVTGDST